MIKQKLFNIQQEFKSGKNNYNEFGKFKYRNLENMMSDLKPLLRKYNCIITFNDDIVNVGSANYIKSTITLIDLETEESISVNAVAKEDDNRAGMCSGQMSGCSSSYSRKYGLCGLLAVNEEKDLDSLDNRTKQQQKPSVNNIPIVDNNLELSPEQVKGNFVGYINNVPEKTNKEKLTEFYLSIKDNPTTNLNELNKFYNYYSTKDFKGSIDCIKLWSSWLSRIRN